MTTQEDRWPSICCILACQSATSSALCASTTRFGFDLALHPGQAPEQPAFLHFGFQMPAAGAVRELLARMEADRVPVPERWEEPGYVAFKCLDPDGWRVEVYWEPIG